MSAAAWAEAARVLAVRLDALGDVVMTGAALGALGRARPGRTLTLLTSPAGAAAAALLPDVDEVLVYEAPWMKATAAGAGAAADLAMVARLAAGGFDAAAIFTVYSQSPLPAALLCHLAGIPLRLAHCRENPYQLLTDWVPEPEPAARVRHEVRRQLDLLAAVGIHAGDERLRVRVPEAAARRADALIDELALASPWAVLHPGASAASRRYPHFAEVLRGLRAAGVGVVLTGTAGEEPLVSEVRAASGVAAPSLAGRLDVAELTALLARAPLLVSNNTGPVHLAAAVGTPVVDLYALTNPQHTPWGVPHRVLNRDVPCKYCYKSVCPAGHHECLRGVAPAAVVSAALDLLAAPRRAA